MSDFFDRPVGYWPDAFTRAVAEASPRSQFFKLTLATAIEQRNDVPDDLLVAADVASVMDELEISVIPLAGDLDVPPAFMHAVYRGWRRLGLRGLLRVAEALDVPLAAFFLDDDGKPRLDVRRYQKYRLVAPEVTSLGEI